MAPESSEGGMTMIIATILYYLSWIALGEILHTVDIHATDWQFWAIVAAMAVSDITLPIRILLRRKQVAHHR